MRVLAFWTVVAAALAACGGDPSGDADTDGADTDTNGTDDTDIPTGDVVEVPVSAASGGTVEAFGAVLDIPADALGADTTITVALVTPGSAHPAGDTILGQVFAFGPDGTTFDPPATLTLPTPAAPATGLTQVVSWLDGGAWVDLVSTVGDGVVSAPVEHFTDFAAREIEAPSTSGLCAFTACGGDVTGDWTPTTGCSESAGELFSCEIAFLTEFSVTGGYHFATDGTYTYATEAGTVRSEHTAPAECLPPISACDELYADFGSPPTCTGDVAVSCTCSSEGPYPAYEWSPGTWSTTATELVLTVPSEGPDGAIVTRYPYCVDGDTLTLLLNGGSSVGTYTR